MTKKIEVALLVFEPGSQIPLAQKVRAYSAGTCGP